MGRILDRFGDLQFHNEAEVSLNFIVPLLSEFLEYRTGEILPEHLFPAFDIPQNRKRSINTASFPPKAKPDYVVAINGRDRVLICESKGPDESLDDYLHQLIAYCIALKTNLLLTTNGTELRVYNANTLVFQSTSVEELDLNFPELYKLLNRSDAAQYTDVERIQTLDLPRSLSRDSEVLRAEHRGRVAVALSDFAQYLDTVSLSFATLELAIPIREAFECDLQRFPAEELYSFQEYAGGDRGLERPSFISYEKFLREPPGVPLLLVGESGIGKTSLLQQILSDQIRACRECTSDVVPVLVKLGHYSRSRSLQELISDALISKGTNISPEQLASLLRRGRFIVLLDAFDEVFEPSIPELERELQSFVDDYRQNKIIITTRRFRLPMLNPIRRYEIQPLSHEKIETFARMYLDSDCRAFLEEIADKRLVKSASNTLLLTLLILLYLREGELPRSRGRVLKTVVTHVCEWDQRKPKRFSLPLSWKVREELLAYLAFSALSSGKSYALDSQSVGMTLNNILRDLESRRMVPPGLTLDQVLDSLAATGFVIRADEGIIFWHRAFMEYFASAEVAQRVESKSDLLDKLVKQPDWEDLLPLAAFRASDPSSFIGKLLFHNVFTAARSLIDSDKTEGDIYCRTVDTLKERCSSSTPPIRKTAIDILRQMEGDYVNDRLCELLDNKFVEIQKVALEEIARRKIPNAHAIVFSRLDWNLPTSPAWFWEGPSGTAVIEALGEFDDTESHLQIISIWRARPDIFTRQSCRRAFLKVARRGKVGDIVKQALLDFYLSDDREGLSKARELADVLMTLGDSDVVPKLVSALKKTRQSDNMIRVLHSVDILASFDEFGVIQQLVTCANDWSLSDYARSRFAEALSKSRGEVPLDVFKTLAKDNSHEVRCHGIRGLGRFSFEDVRAIVLRAIHPPPYEQSLHSGFGHAPVQTAAFEVLAQHGHIELLLEGEHRPEYFYNTSLEVLLDAISNQHLYSMVSLLEAIIERASDERSVIRAAWVLADLDYINQAQEIIEGLIRKGLPHGWVAHDIVQGIHRLPAPYALGVVDEILSRSKEIERDHSGYLRDLCIEALARIGTAEACERLSDIVELDLEDTTGIDAEHALRTIEFLTPRDREGWLLQLMREHPRIPRLVLKRALDTLGIIGGRDSLPLLQEYLKGPHPDDIRATCFWAIQSIHRRAGQLWFNDEERGV